jgi:hypothetical protein
MVVEDEVVEIEVDEVEVDAVVDKNRMLDCITPQINPCG